MVFDKYRQVLEEDTLKLPGLVLFGHNISSKATLPLDTHIHNNCLEIVVVIKGNECYYVENKRYELTGGDVFISYVNQPHRSGNAVQGKCEIIWFIINPYIDNNFLGLSKQSGDLIKDQLLDIHTHELKTDKEGMNFLKKSFDNFSKSKSGNKLYAQILFVSFISKLIFMQNQLRSDDSLMKNILHYVDVNIYNIITIHEICDVFNISLSGFKHKFKEYSGVTPRDYINSMKIKKAKELLKSGKSVTETAMLLSFNTSDYFSVVFKKYTACSPSKFIDS
jgi:AraC-like DNA-binding protein/quercetin dioxygenase-like cupin family protein